MDNLLTFWQKLMGRNGALNTEMFTKSACNSYYNRAGWEQTSFSGVWIVQINWSVSDFVQMYLTPRTFVNKLKNGGGKPYNCKLSRSAVTGRWHDQNRLAAFRIQGVALVEHIKPWRM